MSAAIQAWFDIFLPTTSSIDATEDERAIARLHAAGLHFRQSTYRWHPAAAGYLGSAVDADERFVALVDEPGARGRMPAGAAFTYHGLGIVHAAMGRPDAAHRAWTRARELFAEYDHHALMAFTLLGEMRDVALTYGAAEPATRRRLAAEAEATLGRAGGALRPGVSPQLAWLGCLALDGRWDEALRILDDLPPPGNAHLRREMTNTRAVLARHRGEPDTAWAQIRPLLPGGARDRTRRHHPPGGPLPPAPRGRPLPRRGRSIGSASLAGGARPLARLERERPRPRRRAGLLGALPPGDR